MKFTGEKLRALLVAQWESVSVVAADGTERRGISAKIGIARYSGVRSPNAIRKALIELGEIGFLKFPEAGLRRGPDQPASAYIVMPNSDELYELAQAFSARMKTEIAAERELRRRLRSEKTRAWRKRPDA